MCRKGKTFKWTRKSSERTLAFSINPNDIKKYDRRKCVKLKFIWSKNTMRNEKWTKPWSKQANERTSRQTVEVLSCGMQIADCLISYGMHSQAKWIHYNRKCDGIVCVCAWCGENLISTFGQCAQSLVLKWIELVWKRVSC